jgi:hypothetical protein
MLESMLSVNNQNLAGQNHCHPDRIVVHHLAQLLRGSRKIRVDFQ